MESIKLCLTITLALLLAVSCVSDPKPKTEAVAVEAAAPQESVFNPSAISREQYDTTKEDVQKFIEELNRIIRSRNYNAWKDTLAPEYFNEISSAENLNQISEQPAMKTRRIVLRTAEDYFIHVVVPSRANSRVDDIEFVDSTRVKAFTVNVNRAGEEQRLRLYDLEKTGDMWKIIH